MIREVVLTNDDDSVLKDLFREADDDYIRVVFNPFPYVNFDHLLKLSLWADEIVIRSLGIVDFPHDVFEEKYICQNCLDDGIRMVCVHKAMYLPYWHRKTRNRTIKFERSTFSQGSLDILLNSDRFGSMIFDHCDIRPGEDKHVMVNRSQLQLIQCSERFRHSIATGRSPL